MEGEVDQGDTPSRRNVVRDETSTPSEQVIACVL